MCVCVCVPPFVSGHHSERIRVGQLCQRQSGGSRAVSNRAVTLIANHTHECTHFLEGASQHILRNLGSVYTQTLSSITAVFTLSHRCKHVHTHTHTHTGTQPQRQLANPSIYRTVDALRADVVGLTFVFTLYPLTDPLMLITAGISQQPPCLLQQWPHYHGTHSHPHTFQTHTYTTGRANKQPKQ